MKRLFKFCLIVILQVFFLNFLYGQEEIILSGTVYDDFTKKPVDLASIIVHELGIKSYTTANGQYKVKISGKGTYTIGVMSYGLARYQTTLTINESMKMDFTLKPIGIRGAALTIREEKEKQKVSRKTMTVEDLKEVPASLGDSINALTSLPGVDRTDGFFGPLVIRGAGPHWNRYYVDGMPINDPMHFGGLHSVVANEMMSEVDLYSSAFPSKYGGPLAAVIDITTLDTVKDFGGIVDIGLITATALVKMPIKKILYNNGKEEEQNAGYIIASGRLGYLTLIIPEIYKLIKNDNLTYLPEYYDYQFKGKYYIDKFNSFTLLFLGSADTWKMAFKDVSKRSDYEKKGEDPLFQDLKFKVDSSFYNFGAYYTFDTGLFKNTLMGYASLTKQYSYFDAGADSPAWAQDIYMDSRPNIYGIKDSFSFEWIKNISEIRGALEYTYYKFIARGKTLASKESGSDFDLGNPNLFDTIMVDMDADNTTYSGYLDNKFTFGGLKFIPGARWDYLVRSKESIVSPKGLISYKFPTETTLSLAGGQYKSFFQTNPYFFSQSPQYSVYGKMLEPEKAIHSVAGIEQKYDLFTFNIEGYYNYFYNIAVAYGHYDPKYGYVEGQNSAKLKSYGYEIMLRKDKRQGINDFFGWLSYTYNQSSWKSGITGNVYDKTSGTYINQKFDPNGDNWVRNNFEREHTMKLVMGYKHERWTFSGRFQLYTSFPYTPISGNEPPTTLSDGRLRYAPIYSDDVNSKHLPLDHRLDLRVSYQTNYKWGHIKWYIEVINVYGLFYTAKNDYHWYYNKPYDSGNNPKLQNSDDSIPLLPNFGVEIKF